MIQYKTLTGKIEVKADVDGALTHIRAYAAAFNNIDSWGDIIEPTAFDDFMKSKDLERMKFCYQHRSDQVLGKITASGVDNFGFWIEADVADTTLGVDVSKLLKQGALDEMSIGYIADKWHCETRENYEDSIRCLDAITVWEVSVVTRAANASATIQDVKADASGKSVEQMTDKELYALKQELEKEIDKRIILKI